MTRKRTVRERIAENRLRRFMRLKLIATWPDGLGPVYHPVTGVEMPPPSYRFSSRRT